MMAVMLQLPSLLGATGADEEFRSRWRPDLGFAVADATALPDALPAHCRLAVVGAGWGGAYFAWRMAVDTKTVDAKDVCVFEANGRVGGRIYSIHGLPNFADLAVDVGGYRFQQTQKLPADLVWKALKLPTQCYDWQCAANCEGTTCYVIKDAYGNNEGYATGIDLEALLTVRQEVAKLLPEEEWFGFTAAAGLPKHLGDAPLQDAS